jgi:hypothetical protein
VYIDYSLELMAKTRSYPLPKNLHIRLSLGDVGLYYLPAVGRGPVESTVFYISMIKKKDLPFHIVFILVTLMSIVAQLTPILALDTHGQAEDCAYIGANCTLRFI